MTPQVDRPVFRGQQELASSYISSEHSGVVQWGEVECREVQQFYLSVMREAASGAASGHSHPTPRWEGGGCRLGDKF